MKKGKALITIGLLLIAAALCLVVYNLVTTYIAGVATQKAADMLADNMDETDTADLPDYVLNPEMELPIVTIDGRDYVGILEIEPLDLKFSVLNEWNYPNLRVSPCKYASTPYLGGFVICAHNYDSHFGRIKNLLQGDRITFTDMEGNVFNYEVVGVEIVIASIDQLHLVGCDGDGARALRHLELRYREIAVYDCKGGIVLPFAVCGPFHTDKS